MLISPKKLENVMKKLNNGKGSQDQSTADDLKALLSECLQKLAGSLSFLCWDMTFPEDWLCSMNGSESGGCNELYQIQANRWAVCDAKSLGLRMARVSLSTEIRERAKCICAEDACTCWTVSVVASCRVSREWQKEIVVVQLDVKKAFDHVDHRTAFKAMKLQGVNLFSMVLIVAIWNGSCMKARLVTVSSNNVRMSRGLSQGPPESPVIFTMIMELVLRDLIKSWITRKLAWRLDDFALAAICCADDVMLVAVSMSAAEIMVTEVIAKLKEVGLCVGAQKTHWTSYPKMIEKKHHGGWTVCFARGRYWSLWDQRCAWTGTQDTRSHTDLLKPTNVWRSGSQF